MSGSDHCGLAEHLVTLRRKVDTFFNSAVEAQPSAFRCAEGCSKCCGQQLSVFAIEAASVRQALARLASSDPARRERVRMQATDTTRTSCALLVDDRCTVYADRPLICRSHGLAVVESRGGDTKASHCSLNFVDVEPSRQHVMRLDAINQPLSVLAALWDGGTDGVRVELRSIAAE